MIKRITLPLLTLLTCLLLQACRADSQVTQLPRGDAKAAGFAPEKLDRVASVLKEAVGKKQIAGGSMLIARNGKVVSFTTAGMQDAEANVPLSEGTIFRIASMSKPITSAAIMVLVDDGKLNVTDHLSKFVPEFKDMTVVVPSPDGKSYAAVKADREITIHDLLTHTSGITYRLMNRPFVGKLYEEAGISDGLVETPGRVGDNVRKLARLPLICQPGSAWQYGLNTDVLGHVVEVVSGKSLEQFCRKRIFEPLKMNDTWFILPGEKRARLSALYAVSPDKTLTRVGDKPVTQGNLVYSATYSTRDGNRYFSGGAGLASTAGDYFRFCQMLMNRGELDGVRVLKSETVDRMTHNQIGDLKIPMPGFSGAMGYGFGIVTEQAKGANQDPAAVGSYGWGGAFGTSFWVDPKNELIGVFMSQVYPPDFSIGQELKRLTYEAAAQPADDSLQKR